jgi:membrane fusion protein, adhesin transport system
MNNNSEQEVTKAPALGPEEPAKLGHYLLWGCLAFVVVALIWAKYASLDEVTHAEGKVIPSSKLQVIQNLEGGIVSKILVREGQIIKKGQVLMHIDDTRFSSSYKEAAVRADSLKAKAARLEAEAYGKPIEFSQALKTKHKKLIARERALYDAHQNELKTKVSTLDEQLNQRTQELRELQSKLKHMKKSYTLVDKELKMTKPLISKGAVSPVEVLRLERQANDLEGEIASTEHAIKRTQAGVSEAANKIKELKLGVKSKALDELNTLKGELAPLLASKTALEDRVKRTAVRSPVNGTVKQILINTVGGVVQPGKDIVEIVPLDDTLLIEAKIRPKDIGFIHPGQVATVKISAYDYSIYGGLKGTVEHISADTIEDEKEKKEHFYKIYVRTKKNSLGNKNKPLLIIPGMIANVDILTGRKTVMDYVMKPILKAKQQALRER